MGEKSGRNERAAACIEGIIVRRVRCIADGIGETTGQRRAARLFPGRATCRAMQGDLLAAFAERVALAGALTIGRKPGSLAFGSHGKRCCVGFDRPRKRRQRARIVRRKALALASPSHRLATLQRSRTAACERAGRHEPRCPFHRVQARPRLKIEMHRIADLREKASSRRFKANTLRGEMSRTSSRRVFDLKPRKT